MNSLELIKQLVSKVIEFEKQSVSKDELTMNDFANFIQEEPQLPELKNSLVTSTEYPLDERTYVKENNIERVISQHLLFLYRYIKFYSKMVFTHGKMRTIEEFGMLVTVMQHNTISKSDLIKRNIIDKSSGIEIVNRLVKMELLQQIHNDKDKRSQLIQLTQLGRMELFTVFEKMDQLGHIATGELTDGEKIQLAKMLKKLDHFHYDNYTRKGNLELTDYLPNVKDLNVQQQEIANTPKG